MKRIWSAILAAALALGLAATGFAEGTPPGMSGDREIRADEAGGKIKATSIEKYALYYSGNKIPEGEPAVLRVSVNSIGANFTGSNFTLVSSQKPESVTAELEQHEAGNIKCEIENIVETNPEEFSSRLYVAVTPDKYTPEDIGKIYNGKLSIIWKDGSVSEIQLQVKLSEEPHWDFFILDENGKEVKGYALELGSIYTIKTKIVDRTDVLRQKQKVQEISAKWEIENGSNCISVLKGSEYVAPIDGEEWDDTAVYTVDYSADKLTDFPFQMKFRAETLGKFEFGSRFYYDGTYGIGEFHIYTITGPSNIVPPADINDAIENPTGSGIVIDVPQNMGLNKDSFESIWEKANGQPVTLNANGAKLTFDTAEPLSAEFLRDLQNRNDNFFNPAVYSRIPQKAQEAGYHGGRWMEFMYSGVLPGKMSVTVDVPQNTFPTGTALRLWYYDTLTGRASLDPATVTFNGNRATFSITHCSTYALYLAGYDPNPGSTQKPDDKPDPKPEGKPDPKPDNKPGSGSSSGSGSGSTEKTFGWADMREEIRAAKAGDTLRFTVSADEKVPASLLRALKSKEDVALILRYGNSKSVTISSDAIGSIEKAEYRFNELQQLFASQNEERESAETVPSDKKNPGTGAPEKTGLSLLAFLPLGALLLKKHSR